MKISFAKYTKGIVVLSACGTKRTKSTNKPKE